MKTAVDMMVVGRERAYNPRFQQMCSHYLVEPVLCRGIVFTIRCMDTSASSGCENPHFRKRVISTF